MSLTRKTIFVAALIASSAALAQSASKPTDPQIAHIAYTADEIDIKAGQLAKELEESKGRCLRGRHDPRSYGRERASARTPEEAEGRA